MVRSIISIGIVTALMPGVAVSEDPAPTDRERRAVQARKLSSGTVITNDLLDRLYGPSAAGPPAAATETATGPLLPDPLQVIDYELARRRENRRQLKRAEDRVQQAERSVQKLESRRLAIVNPFLPRPVLSAGEAQAWEGLDNAARVRLTEEAIETARVELEAARKSVQRLRRGD